MFKKITSAIVILFTLCLTTIAQNKKVDDFSRKFMQGKQYLAQHKTKKALPIFKNLLKKDPKNFNLNYLIGICYQEEYPKSDSAIHFLNFSTNKVVSDYDPESPKERAAPVYAHYFLVISYSKQDKCQKAEKQKEEFLSIYEKRNFYTSDVKKWVEKCGKEEEREETDTSKTSTKEPELSELPKPDSISPVTSNTSKNEDTIRAVPLEDRDLVTTGVEYGTDYEMYGIQVGAFSKLVPKASFTDLKNVVEYHLDSDGMIRAVIGDFRRKSHAENVLKAIKEEGYKDAFIVKINEKNKKGSKEILMADGVKLKRKISGNVTFKVQIGAYDGKIPKKLARNYLDLKDIDEYHQDGLTIITSGKFSSYEKAQSYEKELKEEKGLGDAFIVAFNRGEKIPLEKGINYVKNTD